MNYIFRISVFLLLLITSATHAQQSNTEGLPVKLGDSIVQVQAALQTQIEPVPYESAVTKGGVTLRLRTKGVWTSFSQEGKAITIRLDAPFKGSVGGVKIGDTLLTLRKQLGEPTRKPFSFGANEAYVYSLGEGYSTRFDVDESGEVETIFINKSR